MKIELYYIGKPRSREANTLAAEYGKRASRYCRFEAIQLKNDAEAESRASKAYRVVLDPAGRAMRSEDLAALVERVGRDMAFFVGGANGFGDAFRDSADCLLALSTMTLPHELARVVLAEQIYRAFTILRNHPYPR